MKKIMITLSAFMLLIGASAQADTIDRLWTSLFTSTPGMGGEADGAGADWWVEIWNVTDSQATAGSTTPTAYGFSTGFGYTIDNFQFTATESDFVLLRLYDHADPISGANNFIDSATIQLSDLNDEEIPGKNELDVTFDFTGKTWEAVPEPTVIALLGAGGLVMLVGRRIKFT